MRLSLIMSAMTGEQEPRTQDALDLDALPPAPPAHRRFQPLGAAILGPSILWRNRMPGSARDDRTERTAPDTEDIGAALISIACADLPPDATAEQRHQAVQQLLESVEEQVEALLWPLPDQEVAGDR